jgi:hypothetical protein
MGMRKWCVAGIVALTLLSLTAGAAFADDGGPSEQAGATEQEFNVNGPITQYLLDFAGLTDEDLAGMVGCGMELGDIARAFIFADLTGINPSEIVGCEEVSGWGELFHAYDLHPGGGGRGLGWRVRSEDGSTKPGGGKPSWAGPPEGAKGPKNQK